MLVATLAFSSSFGLNVLRQLRAALRFRAGLATDGVVVRVRDATATVVHLRPVARVAHLSRRVGEVVHRRRVARVVRLSRRAARAVRRQRGPQRGPLDVALLRLEGRLYVIQVN
jgi:hypothetical protein